MDLLHYSSEIEILIVAVIVSYFSWYVKLVLYYGQILQRHKSPKIMLASKLVKIEPPLPSPTKKHSLSSGYQRIVVSDPQNR